jgi:ADP-ribosylglycohydrolase
MSSPDRADRRSRIRQSALWAAYGDALGFMTELTDREGFRWRTRSDELERTLPWRRRIGGKFGPTIQLPAGCISDDTQLRLATSRAIRSNGDFDIEAFSSIELTAWLAYALGAGRGSIAAAAGLRKRAVTWATNFFDGDRTSYLQGGGNGAAMRIQPHVWAMRDENETKLLADVVANSVATHGHPRGFVGAALHAVALADSLRSGAIPGPDDWSRLVDQLGDLAELIASDEVLSELWLGQWETRSDTDLGRAIAKTLDELTHDLGTCSTLSRSDRKADYISAVEALDAYKPEQRGSGAKTSVLALVAAWLYADAPADGLLAVAGYFGTDTDTIGTMAGALLGATTNEEPPGAITDREYITHEADRMWAISNGHRPPSFPYPSVVKWTAPKSASDGLLVTDDDRLAIAGLGPVIDAGEIHGTSGKNAGAWQWATLWFGQRVLAKRRQHPHRLQQSQRVDPVAAYIQTDLLDRSASEAPPRGRNQADQAVGEVPRTKDAAQVSSAPFGARTGRSLHEITDEVIQRGLTDEAIGAGLREVALGRYGVENSGQYSAIIAKAVLTRRDRNGQRQ